MTCRQTIEDDDEFSIMRYRFLCLKILSQSLQHEVEMPYNVTDDKCEFWINQGWYLFLIVPDLTYFPKISCYGFPTQQQVSQEIQKCHQYRKTIDKSSTMAISFAISSTGSIIDQKFLGNIQHDPVKKSKKS